jgi:hypothetical protein
MLIVLSLARVASAQDTGAPANPGWIEVAELPGDCADVITGRANPGEPLQVHACHLRDGAIPGDQEFTTDTPRVGNIYITQADFCVEAERVEAGAGLIVARCSTGPRQRWVSTDDGQIHPKSDTTLCWAVGGNRPGPGGGHTRELTLEVCSDVAARLTAWSIPGGSVGTP